MTDDDRREIIKLAERVPVLTREAHDYCQQVSHVLSVRWFLRDLVWRVAERLRLPYSARRHSPISDLCERLSTLTMISKCIITLADPDLDLDWDYEGLFDE